MTSVAGWRSAARAHHTIRLDAAAWVAAQAVAIVIGLVLRARLSTSEDVSWLTDAAERVLSGSRLYVDVYDVNPPLSILLYVPPAALARLLGVGTETVTNGLMFLGSAATAWFSCHLAVSCGLVSDKRSRPLGLAIISVLLILPVHTFAQREHIAVLACLPALVCLAGRINGRHPALWSAVIAGCGAGLAVSIKPVFALAFVLPVLALAMAAGWRKTVGSLEMWVGAVVAAAYGAAVLIFARAFVEGMLPIAVAVYVPARDPFFSLLRSSGFLVWMLVALVLSYRKTVAGLGPLGTTLLGASAGFAAAFLFQGKGFAYQVYPAIALAMLGLCAAMLEDLASDLPPSRHRLLAIMQSAVLVVGCALALPRLNRHYEPEEWTPGLTAAVKAVAPHPTVLALSPELAMGHPFVRDIGGTWAGSAPSTWISDYVGYLAVQGRPVDRFSGYVAKEQEIFNRDIREKRPDALIIQDQLWQDWAPAPAAFLAALDAYEPQGRFGIVRLWVRKDRLAGRSDPAP